MAWLWSRDCFKNFAVNRDAARRAGWSATAELPVLVTFGVAFHFFVAGHRRHFKFGMLVDV